jgi:hypothetical protein
MAMGTEGLLTAAGVVLCLIVLTQVPQFRMVIEEIECLWVSFRVRFMLRFMRRQVERKRSMMQGYCCQCGVCCRTPFRECRYLRGNLCSVWGTKRFPEVCRYGPFDMWSMVPEARKHCTYRFPKKLPKPRKALI